MDKRVLLLGLIVYACGTLHAQEDASSSHVIDATQELESIEYAIAQEDALADQESIDLVALINDITHNLVEHSDNEELTQQLTIALTLLFDLLLEHNTPLPLSPDEENHIRTPKTTVVSDSCAPDTTEHVLTNCSIMAHNIAAIIATPKDRTVVSTSIAHCLNALITIILELRHKKMCK